MNGISLLVALAAVGIDVGWEAASDGQLRYTIRIEKVLIEPLREGQAIVSAVDKNDRGLTKFQLMVGKAGSTERVSPSTQESMVEYGWRPSENGGLDFLVQMTPERLETLANGAPILGQIPAEVTDIRRFYIFVGVGKLPRQQSAAQPAPEPPQYLRDDRSTPASSDREPPSLPRNGSQYGDSAYNRQDPTFTSTNDSRSSTTNYDSRARDNDWRSGSQQSGNQWRSDSGQYAPRDNGNARGGADGYPQARLSDNRYADSGRHDQGGAAYRATLPPGGGYADGGYGQPPVQQPVQQPPSQAPMQQMPPQNYAQQPMQQPTMPVGLQTAAAWPNAALLAQQTTSPPAAQPAAASTEKDEVRPWTPLILTTFALFASMGGNAYLGWLAWSFFWRYRDAASDIVRARQAA